VLSFSLTEEQMRLKERARAFAKDVVEARIPEMDSTNNYPWDVVPGLVQNAIAATKLRLLQIAGAIVEDALFADLLREHSSARQLAEAAEGLASFREKRKPSWYPAAA